MTSDTLTAHCKWCGAETYATSLRECADCWEIRVRGERRPEVALKIIESILEEDREIS